jgi:hypothetical protein
LGNRQIENFSSDKTLDVKYRLKAHFTPRAKM